MDLGFATPEQIQKVLDDDTNAHLQLGARLIKAGVIDEVQLAQALSVRLGVGFTDLSQVTDIDPEAVAKVPERLARRHTLIPASIDGDVLAVAMARPGNVFAIDTVRTVTGMKIGVLAAPEGRVRQAIERCYGFDLDLESSATEMASVEITDADMDEGETLDIEQLLSVAADAPVIKYVDSLISRAIHDRASDIHIEPGRDSVSVRLRVDGKLRPTVAPPKSMQKAVISRIKILANLDIAEKRLPLDGRLHLKFQGRQVDLRVSTLPTVHGEKMVLRVLDRSAMLVDIESLGAHAAFETHLKRILKDLGGFFIIFVMEQSLAASEMKAEERVAILLMPGDSQSLAKCLLRVIILASRQQVFSTCPRHLKPSAVILVAGGDEGFAVTRFRFLPFIRPTQLVALIHGFSDILRFHTLGLNS